MWDVSLIARVKDRKTTELMLFSAGVKLDPSKRDAYIDIINRLGAQIVACDELLAGADTAPGAYKITVPEYRDRLNAAELEDEDRFNMCIIDPRDPNDENLSSYMLDLMDKARKADDEAKDDALASMKDELRSCRDRIDMLTEQLDLSQSENAVLQDEKEDLSEQLDKARSTKHPVPDFSWVDNDLIPISQALDSVVESEVEDPGFYISKLEGAQNTLLDILTRIGQQMETTGLGKVNEMLEKVYVVQASVNITMQLLKAQDGQVPAGVTVPEEEVPSEEPAEPAADVPAEEAAEASPEEVPEAENYDTILSPDELQILTMVDLMKNTKIDYFIDMSMSKRFNENACDDVITFLKVDLGIIRALLSMDYKSKESIEENFLKILDILETAPEPKHQKMYVNSLTADEKILEDSYNRIIAHVQDVMLLKYAYLTE